MDEPLGALDKKLREHMQLEIKQLHSMLGVTIVYVTHDQSEALTMSDRVAVFNNGGIAQIGTPDGLYKKPESPFVAGFIGENNTLEGVVEQVPGNVCQGRPEGWRTLRATAIDIGAQGTECQVAIRPECIRIAAAADEENRFRGDCRGKDLSRRSFAAPWHGSTMANCWSVKVGPETTTTNQEIVGSAGRTRIAAHFRHRE